jgi:carbonic anhydrase
MPGPRLPFRLAAELALVAALVAPLGCAQHEEAKAEAHGKHPAASGSAHSVGSGSVAAGHGAPAHGAPAHGENAHGGSPAAGSAEPVAFAMPFVVTPELTTARSFLTTLWHDNAAFVKASGPQHFAPFRESQKPRATLVTCADSRVQSGALSAAPENELFTIRDIGNQIETAEGSVEYGVEHLNTPVLLILGHTGCGAVKAALEGAEAGPSVAHELATIHIAKKRKADPVSWAEGVIEHVHGEVAVALRLFAERVRDGRLTVVGAVYDFRDDLGHGPGKLTVIDVNGQTEQAKIDAFITAITR